MNVFDWYAVRQKRLAPSTRIALEAAMMETENNSSVITDNDVDHRLYRMMEDRGWVVQVQPQQRVGKHVEKFWQITDQGREALGIL